MVEVSPKHGDYKPRCKTKLEPSTGRLNQPALAAPPVMPTDRAHGGAAVRKTERK